ncbi:TraB/GumN family protein [Psychrosphaera sp. 1_MG-2023]|uniref:TraB/GumN family protein n=1 Tax=Psychrosphaera sp. 1_MG-2023 TaxID=3062643 RepID=UPI0026E19988|nr:TraB/GumN family protein [Psychrosphaera sp. 1_MG-2023]MDO6718891.1 TraB/GumN family protein [Psychrosphaera sp. 1_MG-2023]
MNFCGLIASSGVQAVPLWDNKADNGDDYLVGTIHVGDIRLRDLPIEIKKAIDQVEVIVVEFDPSSTSTYQREFLMAKLGMLPADESLQTVLSSPVYRKLAKVLLEFNVDINTVEQFRPWFLSLMLVQLTYEMQGLNADRGVDVQIVNYARRQGKKIIGLETFEQQLRMFDDLFKRYPNINQDDLILDTIDEIETNVDLPIQMMDAWIAGDMAAFEEIYSHTLNKSEFDKAAEQVLLVERNHNWVPQLNQLLANNSVMVAVGSLHFAGPNSVKKLLKSKFSMYKQDPKNIIP